VVAVKQNLEHHARIITTPSSCGVFSLYRAYVELIYDVLKTENFIIGPDPLGRILLKQDELIFVADFVAIHAT